MPGDDDLSVPNGDGDKCSSVLVLVCGDVVSVVVEVDDGVLKGVSAPGVENGAAKGLALFLKCSVRSPVGT